MQAPDSFRTARWLRTLNLVLQAVLFLSFFGGLNYLARNYAWRFDLTQHRRHSLSPETLSYLRTLDLPVRIVATFTEDAENPEIAQAWRDLNGLLREYAYATEDRAARISVKYLDVYQQRREAEQFGIEQPNVILLTCGEKRRVVTLDELYRVEALEKKSFLGEQTLTAAILDVSQPARKKIYFLAGHGELQPDDVSPATGLSVLNDQLKLRNFDVEILHLSTARRIPDDAALIVAAAPRERYDPSEVELLRQYLATRAGRVILILAATETHGLDDLLYDWGVLVDDVVIYDTNSESFSDNGDFILRNFSPHPITQTLLDYRMTLRVGLCRSVRPDPGRATGNGLLVTTLAATYPTAWGETAYRQKRSPEYNPGVDLKGLPNMAPANRLGVIVASERVQVRDNLPFSVRTGRLVALGTGDLVVNQRLASEGNLTLFLNAVNWAVERDIHLNIPARPIERFQLSLNQRELTQLRYSLMIGLPAVAALLGLFVYWSRRN
jgi:hypothetical protein